MTKHGETGIEVIGCVKREAYEFEDRCNGVLGNGSVFDVTLELGVKVENLRLWKRSSTHDSQEAISLRIHIEPVPEEEDFNNVRKDTDFS